MVEVLIFLYNSKKFKNKIKGKSSEFSTENYEFFFT